MQNFHKLQTKISSLVFASLFPIVSLAQTETENEYYTGKVGINTEKPTNTLHILSEKNPLRMEGLQSSSTTNDISLVADANGVIYKKLNEQLGIFRGYLNNDFVEGYNVNTNAIYTIRGFNELHDPNNDFNPTTGVFTAPVTGVYRVKLTLTANHYPSTTSYTAPVNYIVGLKNYTTSRWVMRFSILQKNLSTYASGDVGSAFTFEGIATLTKGEQYAFGKSQGLIILANPEGTTGSGIGTFFEIELLKSN